MKNTITLALFIGAVAAGDFCNGDRQADFGYGVGAPATTRKALRPTVGGGQYLQAIGKTYLKGELGAQEENNDFNFRDVYGDRSHHLIDDAATRVNASYESC